MAAGRNLLGLSLRDLPECAGAEHDSGCHHYVSNAGSHATECPAGLRHQWLSYISRSFASC